MPAGLTQKAKDNILRGLARINAILARVRKHVQGGDMSTYVPSAREALELKYEVIGMFPDVPGLDGRNTLPLWLLYEVMYNLDSLFKRVEDALNKPARLRNELREIDRLLEDLDRLINAPWSDGAVRAALRAMKTELKQALRDVNSGLAGKPPTKPDYTKIRKLKRRFLQGLGGPLDLWIVYSLLRQMDLALDYLTESLIARHVLSAIRDVELAKHDLEDLLRSTAVTGE